MAKQSDNDERKNVSPDEARKKAIEILAITQDVDGLQEIQNALCSLADQVEKFKESIFFEREFAVRLKTCGEELAEARAGWVTENRLVKTLSQKVLELQAERDAAAAQVKALSLRLECAVEVAWEIGHDPNEGYPAYTREDIEEMIATKLAEKRGEK